MRVTDSGIIAQISTSVSTPEFFSDTIRELARFEWVETYDEIDWESLGLLGSTISSLEFWAKVLDALEIQPGPDESVSLVLPLKNVGLPTIESERARQYIPGIILDFGTLRIDNLEKAEIFEILLPYQDGNWTFRHRLKFEDANDRRLKVSLSGFIAVNEVFRTMRPEDYVPGPTSN